MKSRAPPLIGRPHQALAAALAVLSACAHPPSPAGPPEGWEERTRFVVSPGRAVQVPVAAGPVTLEDELPPAWASVPMRLELAPTVRPMTDEEAKRCGPGVEGMEQVLLPGAVVLLGEVHGTREIPALAGTLACHAASMGAPVVVALELPREEQPAVDAYLESDGGQEARLALMQGTFWRRPYQDGRGSEAVVALVERLRVWRQRDGLEVSVLAYDAPGQGNVRAEALARRLRWGRMRVPDGTLLVLVGNVQARVVKGAEWDPELSPLGWQLAKEGLPVKSLDARFGEGTAWTCRLAPDGGIPCGEGPAIPPPGTPPERDLEYEGEKPFVRMLDARGREGYHGVFYVGAVTASPPAVEELRRAAR